jgi:hypothetical protein
MLKNVALLAASVAVALLLAEVGLRVLGVSYPSFYMDDPELGGRLRPGAEGPWRGEGGSWVRINRDGMRDREHEVRKTDGAVRIAVLGDSFAEAFPVPADKAFWAVLERELAGCSGRPIEVLNFGVSGYGTAQELILLRRRAWKYRPDIVLLTFFPGNDVRNNSPELNDDPKIPYFVRRDGRLVLDDSFKRRLQSQRMGKAARSVRGALAWLRNHSRVLQVASQARRASAADAGIHGDMAAMEHAAAEGGEIGLDNAIYAPPKTPAWEEAWRVTEELIAAMAREVRSRGARFWLVTLSTGIQAHPDPAVRQAFMKRLGVESLSYPDDRIGTLAAREGIPIIQLAPAMARHAESHRCALHGFANAIPGFGHWNEEGNAVAGKLIAARLCAEGGF